MDKWILINNEQEIREKKGFRGGEYKHKETWGVIE